MAGATSSGTTARAQLDVSARKEKERGMDRDGHWDWIRGLTRNDVPRDGRRVASPARRQSRHGARTGIVRYMNLVDSF